MLVAFRVPEAGPAKASACWCHQARVTEWKTAPHYVTHRLICTWLLFEASKSLSLSPGPQGGRGGVGHGPLWQDTQLRLQPVAGNVTVCFLSSRGSRGGRRVRNLLRAVCELDWQRLSPAGNTERTPRWGAGGQDRTLLLGALPCWDGDGFLLPPNYCPPSTKAFARLGLFAPF